jgi:hypothetical protein
MRENIGDKLGQSHTFTCTWGLHSHGSFGIIESRSNCVVSRFGKGINPTNANQ